MVPRINMPDGKKTTAFMEVALGLKNSNTYNAANEYSYKSNSDYALKFKQNYQGVNSAFRQLRDLNLQNQVKQDCNSISVLLLTIWIHIKVESNI